MLGVGVLSSSDPSWATNSHKNAFCTIASRSELKFSKVKASSLICGKCPSIGFLLEIFQVSTKHSMYLNRIYNFYYIILSQVTVKFVVC
ncbi:hypothetical protein PVAP13_6KG145206 [Panicum virgatum]|uniref:Uncharacterized protein n=1 Tax=Panicum virgatum TaxID=38727 RepID=A0A8T0RAR7_PANVG|nr:hypothetical protein PVAP13_6KG145206 [Panicum virgatum]